jgi:hypothetical protein
MRRGIPLASLNPQQCVKPWREQFSPAEEARQAAYEREQEDFPLYDLEPDVDPVVDVRRHLEILAELLTTPGKDAA